MICKPFRLPSEGVQQRVNFALITRRWFGKAAGTDAMRFCLLLPLWAKVGAVPRHRRRRLNLQIIRTLRYCTLKYKCLRQTFSFLYVRVRSTDFKVILLSKTEKTKNYRVFIRTFVHSNKSTKNAFKNALTVFASKLFAFRKCLGKSPAG